MLILVGAGPGDPELITLKGLKAIQEADIVLYDSLINPKIFNLAFPNFDLSDRIQWLDSINLAPDDFDPQTICTWHDDDESGSYSNYLHRKLSRLESSYKLNQLPELVFVGKRRGHKSVSQDDINTLILKNLRAGKTVVRLKGGDPFIFARGVEELEIARLHNYDYKVIPGLTSGLAVPVSKGITLTMRGLSDSVTLVTGHEITDEKIATWTKTLETGATLIVYMGLSNVVKIIEGLKRNLDSDLTAIAVYNGTLEDERLLVSDLENLAQDMINAVIVSPAILIFGKHINNEFLNKDKISLLTRSNIV